MLAILLKLIPFRDYAYGALALSAVIWYNVHVHNLEVVYAAQKVNAVTTAVAAATKQDELKAAAQIAALTKQHANDVAQVESKYESQIKQNTADHAADLSRLRQRAAQSGGSGNSNVVLDSAGGSGQTDAAAGGNQGTLGLGSVPGGLSLEIVDALRADDAALTKCWTDRDDLVGK
jgi:hypothetical protein